MPALLRHCKYECFSWLSFFNFHVPINGASLFFFHIFCEINTMSFIIISTIGVEFVDVGFIFFPQLLPPSSYLQFKKWATMAKKNMVAYKKFVKQNSVKFIIGHCLKNFKFLGFSHRTKHGKNYQIFPHFCQSTLAKKSIQNFLKKKPSRFASQRDFSLVDHKIKGQV